jgi:hypothetical protein
MVIDLDNTSNNASKLKSKFFENLRTKLSIFDTNLQEKRKSYI